MGAGSQIHLLFPSAVRRQGELAEGQEKAHWGGAAQPMVRAACQRLQPGGVVGRKRPGSIGF